MSNKANESKPERIATYTRMKANHAPYSPGGQMAAIRKYAKRHGLKIVMSYSDQVKGGGQT